MTYTHLTLCQTIPLRVLPGKKFINPNILILTKQVIQMTQIKKLNKIRVGTKIIHNLSRTFYPNPNMIFDELVSNSRDAMSKTVKIHIDENSIIMEDDGEGMNKSELIKFFFISHSSKSKHPTKKKGNMKREIIGRFGIGKLSLYQICNSFEIISWKDNTESKAIFNFKDFEKEKFVDDFALHILSEKKSNRENGTRIILHELKEKISARKIKRHLMRTMPLTKDFKIIISGIGLASPVQLRSIDVLKGNISNKYEISEHVDGVGNIEGTIAYKKSESTDDFGVFIRVFGRLVTLSNPHSVINFSGLTHARQFARRIYAELNINGLNDSLQTNRAGFITTNPPYQLFQKWLKRKLNQLNTLENENWQKNNKEVTKTEITSSISDLFSEPEILRKVEYETKYKGVKLEHTTPTKKSGDYIKIKNLKFKISVEDLGLEKPEAVLDSKHKKIIINSSNPLYEISRKGGGIWGLLYHSLKACIIVYSIEISKNLDDFQKNYNKLTQKSEEITQNMKRRLIIRR
jgi:hypothetical protein